MAQKTHPTPVHVPLVTQPMGIWKSLQAVRRNAMAIIPKIATTQPMVSGKTGKRWHMVMDPQALRRMLLERLDDYPKSDVTKNLLRPAIGDSLFIAEGAHWRWQRRATAPVFSHRNVMNLSPLIINAADRCADRLGQAGPRAVDLYSEMITTTFEVISDVTFSGDGVMDRDHVHAAIDAYMEEAGKISLFDILGLPDWLPRPGRLFADRSVKQMKSVADQAIAERAARGSDGQPDLMDLMLAGEDPETRRSMNQAELRDNLLTFIVAGHETTALTLSWALYLLAFDPQAQERARDEIAQVLGDGPVTGESTAQLTYLRNVVNEALRLYPPAAILSRTALAEDTLCGREVRRGDTVMIPIYALHRSELHWDKPDHFIPDRWAQKPLDRYCYLPFGDGPRICIGASFAVQEAMLVLATLLRKFRFHAVPGRDPEPVMILTLRPEGGVWLQAEPL